ncbi:related to Adiponectin receptor 1 [Pseudozyma flocculosa]|uniref:Related to Adiponectin receptor 1 n=1 Tax=Pseudozyma flocculosa TaxID=84751 RepID=A0A5C3EQX4_9BASI|nr:related to Adiponectin receptor 1 [Pseudozyma flocculosa]
MTATAVTPPGHRPKRWISLWLGLSSLIVAWDFHYVLLRPRSMKGGDLAWIWSPYELYGGIDYIYGPTAWDAKDGFPAAQSILNVAETFLNFVYLYLAHVRRSASAMAAAPLVGFAAVVMTFSKTVLYWLNDYCCGWCKTGHNNWHDRFFLWIVPNGLWLLVPGLIIYSFGAEMFANLRQLPEWAKDNPLIRRGYRRPGGTGDAAKKTYEHDTFAKCWRSVWAYWHNETVNIHTHMWGAMFAFVLSSTHLLQHFDLLPALVRPLSHHPLFYPSSLTFTTAAGKVLRLAAASYPATKHASSLSEPSNVATGQPPVDLVSGPLSSLRAFFAPPSAAAKVSQAASQVVHNTLTVRPPDTLDVVGFGIFFVAAVICLGFSASYHTVGCHSQYVIGIVVMIVGSFLPALHYGFYCHPHFQLAYSVAIILMGSVAIYVVIAPKYGTPHYRPYRTAVFLVLGLSAIFPVLHIVNVYGYDTITQTMGLRFLLTSGALYVVGAVLYMLRVPERFAPGRFDLVGSSHQIFHCLILLAAAAHYISLRRAYAFWHTVETMGGVGKEGVCRALES